MATAKSWQGHLLEQLFAQPLTGKRTVDLLDISEIGIGEKPKQDLTIPRGQQMVILLSQLHATLFEQMPKSE